MRLRKIVLPTAVMAALVIGCGPQSMGAEAGGAGQNGQQQSQDYGTTKQMVIDILHSQEGRTALQEIAKDPSFKQQLAVNESDVAKGVEKILQTQKNQSFLSQQAKDPKFAQALTQAIQPQLTQVNRQLMKDPIYQKEMMVLLRSPEFMNNLQSVMQTPQMRGQIMQIMTDALQTPSFRLQFEDALKKAVKDSIQQSAGAGGGQKGKSGGGGDGGGDGGGGDGGGDGGSS